MRAFLVTAAFALLSLFPAIQWLTGVFPDAPLGENRRAAAAPAWGEETDVRTYLQAWQRWFNDRYAGRNLLIRVKTQLDYSVFSYSDKVHIGRDGWLFYRSVLDVEKPLVEAYSERQFDDVVAGIKRLTDWLRVRGITVILLDNQLKDEFYPEMLPRSRPRRRQPSRYDQFRQRLRDETGAIFIDTSAILERVKRRRVIFHRTDFHWNDPAAFAVARRLVDRLAKEAGAPVRGWRLALEVESRRYSGTQAAFLPLLKPLGEESLFVHPTWSARPATRVRHQGPFEYSFFAAAATPQDIPPTVVFGDSFFDGIMRSGFEEHFVSLRRARERDVSLEEVMAALPPETRFVILQCIEIAIDVYAAPVDYAALNARAAAEKERTSSRP